MKRWHKIVAGCMGAILLITSSGLMYLSTKLNQVFEPVEEITHTIDLSTNENLENIENKPLNIALFGVDCRSDDYKGCRSESIIILSYK